jgi:hypothetical protein
MSENASEKTAIQGLVPGAIVAACGADLTAARKVSAAVHQRFSDDLRTCPPNVRRLDVDRIADRHRVGSLRIVAREASAIDPFV